MKRLLLLFGAASLLLFPASFAEDEPLPLSPKSDWSAEEAYEIGVDYATNQDFEAAFEWFRKSAEAGNLRAQSDLAFMYTQGLGTPQDHEMALDWYTRAAEHGLPAAQTNLAVMYLNGLGTPVDVSEAYKWVKLAAREGQLEGIELLETLDQQLTRREITEGLRRVEAWEKKNKHTSPRTPSQSN